MAILGRKGMLCSCSPAVPPPVHRTKDAFASEREYCVCTRTRAFAVRVCVRLCGVHARAAGSCCSTATAAPQHELVTALGVPQHFLLPSPSSHLQTVFPLSSCRSCRAAGRGAARGEEAAILANPPQAGVRLAPMWRGNLGLEVK